MKRAISILVEAIYVRSPELQDNDVTALIHDRALTVLPCHTIVYAV